MNHNTFSKDDLILEWEQEADKICRHLRQSAKQLRKRGVVVALSGGIDSSTVAALCVRALGKNKVFGLLMP